MPTAVNLQVNYSNKVRMCTSCGRLFNPSNAIHTYCTSCAAARKKALSSVYRKRSREKQTTTANTTNTRSYRVEDTLSQLIEYRKRLVSEICKINAAAGRLRRSI